MKMMALALQKYECLQSIALDNVINTIGLETSNESDLGDTFVRLAFSYWWSLAIGEGLRRYSYPETIATIYSTSESN